jgi:succinyl-diaminopimelate desuccinylase
MNPPRTDPTALARDLLRCPSVTPAEAGALGLIEGVLKAAGFTVHRITFADPGTAPVENLYARIGTASPHFAFAGHVDVVPPGEQAKWTHPPFAGDIADGTLYGRGAVDMKGGIASALAATLDYLAAHGGRPKGSISFLITGDEEGIAVNGTVKLVQWAAERGETFDHCILGEPSNAETIGDTIKVGRRGSLNGTLVVTGKQGHVAYPERAENPVRGLIALMSALMASHSQTSLKALIEKRAADAAAGRIRWHIEWEPSNADSFVIKPGPFLDLVCAAIRDVTGKQPKLSTSGGTSDARFIKNYCSVLEFGLVGQSMHQVDERTTVADLATLTAVYRRVLERYFG